MKPDLSMYHHSSCRISNFIPIYKESLKRKKEKKKKDIPRAPCIDFFYPKQRDSPSYMIYHNHLICLTPSKKEQWIQEKVLTCKNIIIWQVFLLFVMGHFPIVVPTETQKCMNSNSCHS